MNSNQILNLIHQLAMAGGVTLATTSQNALLQIAGGLISLAAIYFSHRHNADAVQREYDPNVPGSQPYLPPKRQDGGAK